jgi:tripartite-type tricarboxylate transporter receptor subunit TctC
VLNVHTKGVGEALTEVIAGRADCYFALVFQAKRMVDAGKVSALAASSPKRSALMPDIATTEELGFPNSSYNFWVGALVPFKTPRAVVDRIHADITALVESPDVSEQIRKLGCDPLPMPVKAFEDMVARELRENAELIKRANIKAN